MSKAGRGVKASKLPLSGKFEVHPDIETMVALEGLSVIWGGTLGQAVTGVLDTWAKHALGEAMQLQGLIAQVHPEYAGAPLLSLPRHVFMAGCRAQDLANREAQGQA